MGKHFYSENGTLLDFRAGFVRVLAVGVDKRFWGDRPSSRDEDGARSTLADDKCFYDSGLPLGLKGSPLLP